MKIDVIATANDAKKYSFINKNIVVIDVLRATTTMIQACNNNCSKITPCLSIAKAKDIAAKITKNKLLGGERKGIKIKGFDLSNSPLEYTSEKVKNKHIIITTTNGTKALYYASPAHHIYIGAFINAKSVADQLLEEDKDIVIICAGTNGNFALEDISCCGLIIHYLTMQDTNLFLTDLAIAAHSLYKSNSQNLKDWISHATHYRTLTNLDLQKDIDFCLTINKYNIVPEYKNGMIINRSLPTSINN